MEFYLSQIIGIVAVLFFVASILFKEKSSILFYQLIANILYFFQYILLGATGAASMNLISAFRCYIFKKYSDQKEETPIWYLLAFLLAITLFGVTNYKGLFSLIPVFITFLYIISSYFDETKILRIVFLICSLVWVYYNFTVGAYVSLVGNAFEFTFSLISIIKYKKK